MTVPIIAKAIPPTETALDLVLSDDSELNELWGETEYYDDWRANIAALKTALAK